MVVFSSLHFSLMLTFILVSVSASGFADEINPSRRWTGISSAAELISHAPADGVIQDSQALKELWSKWQSKDEVPEVDFANKILVVATTRGFDTVRVLRLNLAPGGNLQFALQHSRTRKPGFGYMMVELPRSEIKQVNGRPLAVRPEPVPKTDQRDEAQEDSVEVEVVGLIENGPNGLVIKSGEMTFGLDLMRFRIKNPIGKRARVSGPLNLKQANDKQPWKINVAKIHVFEDGKPNNKPLSDKMKQSFQEIEIIQSGGIAGIRLKTVIRADGKVTRTNDQTRVTESFELKPESINAAHKLVDETDWSKVKIAPPPGAVADAFQYSVVIKTDEKTHRFEFSGASIRDSQSIRELLKAVENR